MRILWLKTELLHPVDKGGKIRTYQMLKEMKRQHHLTYLTLDEAPEDRASHEQAHEYCHELICVPHRTEDKFTARFYGELALNFVSPLPYFIQKYRSAAMARMLKSVLREQKPDLLVCDFLHPSVNLPDAMPCPSLLFQHNVEAMIWQRHYEEQTNPLKKAYLCNQWKKTQQYEKAACHRFDRVVAVSVDDGETMKREYGLSDVSDIPTGVDTAYFQRNPAISAEPHHLVFTGSMDWLPNEDAILYFAEQILPRIKNILPDIRLTIVGRSPSPRVFQLSRQESGITTPDVSRMCGLTCNGPAHISFRYALAAARGSKCMKPWRWKCPSFRPGSAPKVFRFSMENICCSPIRQKTLLQPSSAS